MEENKNFHPDTYFLIKFLIFSCALDQGKWVLKSISVRLLYTKKETEKISRIRDQERKEWTKENRRMVKEWRRVSRLRTSESVYPWDWTSPGAIFVIPSWQSRNPSYNSPSFLHIKTWRVWEYRYSCVGFRAIVSETIFFIHFPSRTPVLRYTAPVQPPLPLFLFLENAFEIQTFFEINELV